MGLHVDCSHVCTSSIAVHAPAASICCLLPPSGVTQLN